MNKTYLTLNNGIKIPCVGLGTWMIENGKVEDVIVNALKIGYRHIDTAEAYGNEQGVGRGIKLSHIKREDIFIQTKLVAEAKTYQEAKERIEQSLKDLDVDYIDLMIIHSPEPWDDFRNGNHYYQGNLEAYRALEDFYLEGKIRAIGVSNFEIDDLENLMKHARIKPMVNQILTHVANTQFNLIKYCQEHDIVVEAYSPLGHQEILNHPSLVALSNKYHVSVAQICIKYTLELGLVSLPKATSYQHLQDNFHLDFDISQEDMEMLINLPPLETYHEYSYFPVFSGKIKG